MYPTINKAFSNNGHTRFHGPTTSIKQFFVRLDLAKLVSSKYYEIYSCRRYELVHRRSTIDLGQLCNWDYNEQDTQSLAIFQHIHLESVDVLVIKIYIERNFRCDNSKIVSNNDVVNLNEIKDFYTLIEFNMIKEVNYTSSPTEDAYPYPPCELGVCEDKLNWCACKLIHCGWKGFNRIKLLF